MCEARLLLIVIACACFGVWCDSRTYPQGFDRPWPVGALSVDTFFPWTQRKDICWHTFFGLKTKEIWMLFRYTMYHFTFTNISQNISFYCVDTKRELSPHVLSVYELTFSDCLTTWSGDMMIVRTYTWHTQSHWPQCPLISPYPHQLLVTSLKHWICKIYILMSYLFQWADVFNLPIFINVHTYKHLHIHVIHTYSHWPQCPLISPF